MKEKLEIDFAMLCRGEGIRTAQPGERHYRNGWICLRCPFCVGLDGNHLGFNPVSNVFTCFRCGRHGKFETIGALLGISPGKAYHLCKDKYSANPFVFKTPPVRQIPTSIKVPGVRKVLGPHRDYLASRGFDDADKLYAEWDLRSTDFMGDYKFRIIAPITYDNQIVSYQGRDITGLSPLRYKACAQDDEIRFHKHCLYGADKWHGDTVIVVEGIFDAWRIGRGAVATFGTGYKRPQVREIAKFRRSWILFDPEETAAMEAAERLAADLAVYREHQTAVLVLSGMAGRDPGEFTSDEVAEVRKMLGKNVSRV